MSSDRASPSGDSSTSEQASSSAGLERLGAAHAAVIVADASGERARSGECERVFALASVTKLCFAYAFLVALEEGSVTLEDECGPEGSTVAHLLAHASGLSPNDPSVVVAPVGTRRIYSSAGFDLLGEHLEQATGIAPREYVAEAVFAPLEMTSSHVEGSVAADGRASAADLARFASELLAPQLVSEETLRLASEVAFPGLDGVLPGFGLEHPCDWGLGLELRSEKQPHWTGSTNSPATFGHFGQSGSFVWVDPEAAIALVCVTDLPFGEVAVREWPLLSDGVLERFAENRDRRGAATRH